VNSRGEWVCNLARDGDAAHKNPTFGIDRRHRVVHSCARKEKVKKKNLGEGLSREPGRSITSESNQIISRKKGKRAVTTLERDFVAPFSRGGGYGISAAMELKTEI